MWSKIFPNRLMLGKFQLVTFLLLLNGLGSPYAAKAQGSQIIYVRKGASSSGDGASWATAFPDLQPALTAATALSGSKEVWVAHGEYKPTASIDRTISFVLPPNTI